MYNGMLNRRVTRIGIQQEAASEGRVWQRRDDRR